MENLREITCPHDDVIIPKKMKEDHAPPCSGVSVSVHTVFSGRNGP